MTRVDVFRKFKVNLMLSENDARIHILPGKPIRRLGRAPHLWIKIYPHVGVEILIGRVIYFPERTQLECSLRSSAVKIRDLATNDN